MDSSVPKKDPMTIPAVLALEIEDSVEWVDSEESDVRGDVVDERSPVVAGVLPIVRAVGH